VGNFIYKRAGLAAAQFLMGQSWFFCPAITVFEWITGTLEFNLSALWGGVAGLFMLVGFYNYSRSLGPAPSALSRRYSGLISS